MFPYLIIIAFAIYIIYYSRKINRRDTEILIGQKREIKQIGEKIQEVLDTEKTEKKQARMLNSVAREANLLLKERRFKQAEKKYLGIIKEDHKNLKAYQGLGLLYLEQEEFEGAAEAFKKITELDPTNDVAFNNLGLSLLSSNQNEEAVKAFEHAIALNTKVVTRYLNLALAAGKIFDYKKEISALEKAYNLDPQRNYLEKIVEAAEKAGDDPELKKALEKLIEKDPSNLEAQRKMVRFEN